MAKLSAVQLHTIAVVAKEAAAVRKQLVDGKTYRPEFAALFRGELKIGHPTPTTRVAKANPELLLAAVLEQLGPRKRVQVVSELIERADEIRSGSIDPAAADQAQRLVRETTKKKSATARGNVTGTIVCELM